MALKRINYQDARPLMKPGDVIAFAGNSLLSKIIRMVTMSNITHVGTILKSQVGPLEMNQVVESTEVNGFCGVNISRFSDRLDVYDGEVYWLPIREDLDFNEDEFFSFLFDKAEKKHKWDALQALKSGFDFFDDADFLDVFTENKEDMDKIYCSELVAAGFEAAGAIPNINCSEVTPIELCRWNIFQNDYYVLNESVKSDADDDKLSISRFNSAAPNAWGSKG